MPWRRIGVVEVYLHSFLTSALDGDERSASRPGRFTPQGKAPGTHWIGGWVGPRAVLDTVVKKNPSPRRESNPRTPIVQLVSQRYTDWAVTALMLLIIAFWKADRRIILKVACSEIIVNAIELSLSWEANSHSVKNFPPFMEPKDSLPCSQEPTTGPYPEPDKSNLQPPNLFP
jgi:hypothetical protein